MNDPIAMVKAILHTIDFHLFKKFNSAVCQFSMLLCFACYHVLHYLWAMMMDNTKAQMRKGVLEMCILALVSDREMYTSELLEKLKEAELIVVEGTLYPLLNRLKDAGFLEYQWQESPTGPPRKYYRITPEGGATLAQLKLTWQQLVQSVSLTLEKPEV